MKLFFTLKFWISLFNVIDSISFSSISTNIPSSFVHLSFKEAKLGRLDRIAMASSWLAKFIFNSVKFGRVANDLAAKSNYRLFNSFTLLIGLLAKFKNFKLMKSERSSGNEEIILLLKSN